MGIVWFWLYRDPEAHPGLSPDERAYITSGREPPLGAKPSIGAILSKTKFLGIIIARFLTEPAWQTFAFWIPLYMVSVRGMDIKQFALFAWLPFLFSDLGCIFGGYLAPPFTRRTSTWIHTAGVIPPDGNLSCKFALRPKTSTRSVSSRLGHSRSRTIRAKKRR